MSFRRATVALLIVLAIALPGWAQSRNGSRATYEINGSVRDDRNHQTLENIQVDLKVSGGVTINSVYTRGNGEFEFTGIPNGEYFIEINLKDYEPYREQVSIFNAGRLGMGIFLQRPMADSVTPTANVKSDGAISVHELTVPAKAHDEYEKGMGLLYAKSDYRGAIVQFQRAIKDFPNFYEAYAQEGGAYSSLGEMDSAEQALRKSIDLSSGQYPDALLLLSGMLNNARRFSEAETLARKGVGLDPTSWRGHLELARALLGLKRLEDAEKDAIESRDLKPTNPSVYLILANIHIQRNDRAGLLKDLDGYLKLVPAGPQSDQARQSRDELQVAMNKEAVPPQAVDKDRTARSSESQPKSNTQDQTALASKDETQPTASDRPDSDDDEKVVFPPLPPPEP
jgi:tetratricopeptide (TPR) repeat protein